MNPIAVYGPAVPATLSQALDRIGLTWKHIDNRPDLDELAPDAGWELAVVIPGAPDDITSSCRLFRNSKCRVLVMIPDEWLPALAVGSELFSDFAMTSASSTELEARLQKLTYSPGAKGIDLITVDELTLNTATFQADIGGRKMDLTYMEYELLRFLATHVGAVHSRQELLQRVWGYEYFGGGRTVDVHIRRLRAKLGEENAYLIQTTRSVGYCLQPR